MKHIDTNRHGRKLEMTYYVPKSNSFGIETVNRRLIDLSAEQDRYSFQIRLCEVCNKDFQSNDLRCIKLNQLS